MCFLDKELLCRLPGALEEAQAKAGATMTNTDLSFASFAAVVNMRGLGEGKGGMVRRVKLSIRL